MTTPDHGALAGSWVHSREDDSDGVQVFRRPTYPFPRVRGRKAMSLAPDGALSEDGFGADDRATEGEGRWHVDETGQLVLERASSTDRHEVVSVDAERLVLRKRSTIKKT